MFFIAEPIELSILDTKFGEDLVSVIFGRLVISGVENS